MTIDQHLQFAAFEQGFGAGADPNRARKRHAVDPNTHASWRKGFDAGRAAAELAAEAFKSELRKQPAPAAADDQGCARLPETSSQ
jgi:hypothetical protein